MSICSEIQKCKLMIRLYFIDYQDCEISDFLEFDCPISYISLNWPTATVSNHKGALDYPKKCQEFYQV